MVTSGQRSDEHFVKMEIDERMGLRRCGGVGGEDTCIAYRDSFRGPVPTYHRVKLLVTQKSGGLYLNEKLSMPWL
jgi:hypothetical protein